MFILLKIFLLIILVILNIYSLKYTYKETFTVLLSHNKPYLFIFWQNIHNKKRPVYLDLCYETIIKNCSDSFNIVLMDYKNVSHYLPNIRDDLMTKLKSIPMQTDYIRYSLLYTYGGVWLDFDTIVIKDIKPIYNLLKQYDFIGFGCYYDDASCIRNTGRPVPANWTLMVRPQNILFKNILLLCDRLLDAHDSEYFAQNYHILGKELITKAIKLTQEQDDTWSYYHYPSKCLERDSHGEKLRNNILVSDRDIDTSCIDEYYFIPIYNTSPGFPEWFKELDKEQLLSSNMLISKLYRLSGVGTTRGTTVSPSPPSG